MNELIHFAKIKDGKLLVVNEDVLAQHLKDLGNKDAVVHIKYGRKRTPDQNAFFWSAIIEPVWYRLRLDGWNFTPEECYRFIEKKFCSREYHNSETGEIIQGVKPIKLLSTIEWQEIVMDKIHPWAEDLIGRKIKLPHEFYGMELDKYNLWRSGQITRTEAEKASRNEITTPYPD
jgi:hypothetical protein